MSFEINRNHFYSSLPDVDLIFPNYQLYRTRGLRMISASPNGGFKFPAMRK